MAGQYFDLPFQSLRGIGTQCHHHRKKRRLSVAVEDELEDEGVHDEQHNEDMIPDHGAEVGGPPSADPNLPPALSRQYRAAGQPYNEDIPQGDFPHRAVESRRPMTPSDVEHEVGKLVPGRSSPTLSLLKTPQISKKQKHVAVLTTSLHKFLLEGQYLRAYRAFALLLRTEVRGRQLDIREADVWALGIELLLRKSIQTRKHGDQARALSQSADVAMYDSLPTNMAAPRNTIFCEDGFQKAHDYLQLLIVNYQHRNQHSNTLSSLNFYHVQFGIWVGFVHDQYVRDLEGIKRKEEGADWDISASEVDDNQPSRDLIEQRVLRQAREISDHLDTVMEKHPYSEDNTLIRLKFSISCWLNDLLAKAQSPVWD